MIVPGNTMPRVALNVLQSIKTSCPSRCAGNTHLTGSYSDSTTVLKDSIHSKQIVTLSSLLLPRTPICCFVVPAAGGEYAGLAVNDLEERIFDIFIPWIKGEGEHTLRDTSFINVLGRCVVEFAPAVCKGKTYLVASYDPFKEIFEYCGRISSLSIKLHVIARASCHRADLKLV